MDEELIKMRMTFFGETRDQAIAALSGNNSGGGTSSVYFGTSAPKAVNKTTGRPGAPSTVVKKVGKTEKIKSAEESYLMFWKDKKTKASAMALLSAMGRSELGEPGAYQLWKDKVDEAAEIYNSGKGYQITPFELMNLSKKNQGGSGSDGTFVNTQREDQDPEVVGRLVDSIFQNSLGMNPTAVQRKKYIAEFMSDAKKGTVTTTTRSGKNTTSTTKRNFTEESAVAGLTEKLKTSPEFANDLAERQTLDFNSEINKLMARSING